MTSRVKPSRSSRSSRRPKRPAGSPSTGRRVRQAALAEVKDDLSRFLRLAESDEILITRHGKQTGWRADRLRERGRLARLSVGAPSRVPAASSGGPRNAEEWSWCSTRASAVVTGGPTVVEVVEFETTDPTLRGEMTITISLAAADG